MNRRERAALLAGGIALAIICSALLARAVFAQRAADFARAEARAALVPTRQAPTSDFADRAMFELSGLTQQMRFWEALQRFRIVTAEAERAQQYAPLPLTLIFRVEKTITALKEAAAQDGSDRRRARLEDMVGLSYFYDAMLHAGEEPVEPQLEGEAIAAFRHALRLDGSDADAKTNLEFLLREQRKRLQRQQEHPKPLPDQARAQNAMEHASGLPSQNGSVGRRFTGGY